ncbi:MAG: hypothetical protein ABIO70_18710 [Pseudomonadota bacterium]
MKVGHHLVGLAVLLAAGCHGGAPVSGDQPAAAPPEAEPTVIPGDMVGRTWPLVICDDAARAPFEQHPGWATLVMQRDYPGALAAFSAEPALPGGQARVHAELSAAYRQAARLAAHATVQVWAEERREEDPPEVDCLVGLSQLILAQDAAVASLESCTANVQGPLAKEAAAWLAWRQGGAEGAPIEPLQATPGQPGAPSAAGLPDAGTLPAYALHDRVEGREIPAASPMTLIALAIYHEDAAALAMGGDALVSDVLLAPWRLPLEPARVLPDEGSISIEQIFGSPLLVSDDAWFLADLTHGQGLPAVSAWAQRSALASAIGPCVDAAAGKVDPSCAIERAGRAFEQVRGAMEIRSGGEQPYHRDLAEFVRVGVVRAAEFAAAVAGDEHSMGLLRLNGIDLSTGSSAEPHYLLSIAAWDAHNKNSSRASETLHAQVGHIPGVEVARFPLDALHVRLSRESAPGVPMH